MENSVNNTTESYYLWETQPACEYITKMLAQLLISEHLSLENFRLYFLVIPKDVGSAISFDILNQRKVKFSDEFMDKYMILTKNKEQDLKKFQKQFSEKLIDLTIINQTDKITHQSLTDYSTENSVQGKSVNKIIEQQIEQFQKRDIIRELLNEEPKGNYLYTPSLPHTFNGNGVEIDVYTIIGINSQVEFYDFNTINFFYYPIISNTYSESVINRFLQISYQTLKDPSLEFNNSIYKPIIDNQNSNNIQHIETTIGEHLIFGKSINEVKRECAISFMESIAFFSSYERNPDRLSLGRLYYICNEVASLHYEGKSCEGEIVFLNKNDIYEKISDTSSKQNKFTNYIRILFNQNSQISNVRQLRKLLESTNDKVQLVSDSYVLLGLFSIPEEELNENTLRIAYKVKFCKQAKWEVYRFNDLVMVVEHGIPSLPKPNTNTNDLNVALNNIFQNIDEQQEQKLGKLLSNLVNTKHGATLVITDQAQLEADRLGSSCIATVPRELEASTITSISSIDGAILVDLDAQCYAIGVILDGLSNNNTDNNEDLARGSRYNSAIRYINTTENKTIVAVISVDGMVNILTKKSPPTSL